MGRHMPTGDAGLSGSGSTHPRVRAVLVHQPGGFAIDADERAPRTTLVKKSNDEVYVLIERKDGRIWKKAREGTFHRVKPASTNELLGSKWAK